MPFFCPYKTARDFLLSNFNKIKSYKTIPKISEEDIKTLKKQAHDYLPKRLDYLAQKFGFSYNRVFLRNQKTRFGSCSWCNNINLNISLMRFDKEVIDYVILHELCHTRIKNHSKAFWQEVERVCPNYKQLKQRLKK